MANRNVIVIGASAGGIEALRELLSSLPDDLDASVLIVLHTSSHSSGLLPKIMRRVCPLPVLHPTDGTRIKKGHVYIAPPDHHMILERNLIRVIQGPQENRHRPAIDPLFRSAAVSHGRAVIGVVLTGSLDDGTAGLMVVYARGGEAIIQDPATALFAPMPEGALEQVPHAHVVPLSQIPDLLVHLVEEELPELEPVNASSRTRAGKETKIAEFDMSEIENENRLGHSSAFACPDCGGVLWELDDNNSLRYRCRVGHAITARHLGAEQRNAIESALWSALRALEENASLYRRMAEKASGATHGITSTRFEERARDITANAHVLREFLLHVNQEPEEQFAAEAQER